MPIADNLAPVARRRTILRIGERRGWWEYESENAPGYTHDGVTYDSVTYTLQMPFLDEERKTVLLASEVEGFAYRTALEFGDDAVEEIRFRDGL